MNRLFSLGLVAAFCSTIAWPQVYNKELYVNPFVPGSQIAQESETPIRGLWWDDTMWIPLHIPDDAMLCRPDSSDGTIRCWRVFPGSLLIIPNVQKDDM